MRTLAREDIRWFLFWLGGLAVLGTWDAFFLNRPAFVLVQTAFVHTLLGCFVVVIVSLAAGWLAGTTLYFLETRHRALYLLLTFGLNIIRSIPQIVGALTGYVILTILIAQEILRDTISQLLWMSLVISLFLLPEVVDLVRERIGYYSKRDFVPAMLCCGISEGRIINRDILWKNSRAHLLHKLISIFGVTIFLLCSIDFIISVGLSTDVSLSNFPMTLGGLLAKMDSKQDILAIGTVVTSMRNFDSLFFEHLQGISTAFLIVFTLLCIYKISNGFVRRHRL